jgi:hypothetical protein
MTTMFGRVFAWAAGSAAGAALAAVAAAANDRSNAARGADFLI